PPAGAAPPAPRGRPTRAARSYHARVMPTAPAALAAAATLLVAATAAQAGGTAPVGAAPKSDRAAAKLVHRSRWEPRPDNRIANRTIPTRAELRTFRRKSTMPYRNQVTGHFRGTT